TLPENFEESGLMKDYEIISLHSGYDALENIQKLPIDLILIDYNMPEINGTELCRAIKEIDLFHDVPIVFLTIIEESEEIIKAFSAGVVDYLIKPINLDELSIRIKTHLSLYFARKKFQLLAENMEQLAEQRAKQLVHADRLATLGTLSAGLAHEIKNPATFISGNIQTFEKFWPVLEELIHQDRALSNNTEQLDFIAEEMPGLIDGMKDGVARIRKIVDNLRTFSRKETSEKVDFSVQERIEVSMTICSKLLKDHVLVEKVIPEEDLIMKGDPQQIEQVLINLFTNAADVLKGTGGAKLIIEVKKEQDKALILIDDNGPGIEDEKFKMIWDPFFTTKPAGKGTGLGLPICRTIIENHNGNITAEKKDTPGLLFRIELPLIKKGERYD
ncbi:MAG: response regulator, partial [Candidatus Auribacterota bacterium]|nr:response regulator [Candidatus Auribacterota bacterium]